MQGSITFFPQNRAFYEIMCKTAVQPDRPQMTIQRVRFACWTSKAINTHSKFVTVLLIAFPRQQRLRESASVLLLYVYLLSCYILMQTGKWKLECKLVAWILVSPVWSRDNGNKQSASPTGAEFFFRGQRLSDTKQKFCFMVSVQCSPYYTKVNEGKFFCSPGYNAVWSDRRL